MRISLKISLLVGTSIFLGLSTKVQAQTGAPRYCKTDVGVLGPYPNDGSVAVGDACYGTDANGQRHEGTAVMSRSGSSSSAGGGGNSGRGGQSSNSGAPRYCKTDVGVLGPYPNDGSVAVGDACYGTSADGQRHEGTAVMSRSGH
jgi:hypothetical protein